MNRVVTLDKELRTLLRMYNMAFKINILIPPTANSSYIIASSKIIKKYAEKLENIKLSMIFIIDLTGKINSLSLEDTYHVLREVSEITNIPMQLALGGLFGKKVLVTPQNRSILTNFQTFKDVLTKTAESKSILSSCSTMSWSCNTIYSGGIYVNNVNMDTKWWYWRYFPSLIPSGCKYYHPSEYGACDIHYEREMFFYAQEDITWGLINFYGAEYAYNCRYHNPDPNSYCGSANTLIHSTCAIKYADLGSRLYSPGYYIYAYYTLTNPCPYCSYCGCYSTCGYPQMFIINVIVP